MPSIVPVSIIVPVTNPRMNVETDKRGQYEIIVEYKVILPWKNDIG